MAAGLSLMKSVLTPLSKNALLRLGLAARISLSGATIQKRIFASRTTLVFSNKDLNDVIKIVKSPEDASFLIKSVSETV